MSPRPRRAPDPEVMRRIGALIRAGQIPQAIALARRALETGAEHPQLLHLRSTWLEQQGRPFDALADLQRARTIAPAELPVLLALGDLYGKLGQRLDARDAYQAAVDLRPDLAEPKFLLGLALGAIGELTKAAAAYRSVLDLNPAHAPSLGRLASMAAQQGDWEQARALAARALDIDPIDVFAQLAHVRADVQQQQWTSAEAGLDRLLRLGLSADQLHLALHELGAMRHRQGRHPEAFDAWTRGNDAIHRHYAPLYSGPRGASALVGWLTEYFTKEPAWPTAPKPTHPDPPVTHVFLFGFARSGTTLLEQVLAGHPDVVAMEEKEVLTAAVTSYQSSPEKLSALRAAGEAELAPLRAAYWREVRRFGLEPAGKVFIDKSPFNGLRLPLIARLFPDAKLLFALRDPRDVVFSCFRTPMRPTGLPYELLKIDGAARFYAAYMALTQLYRETLPLDLAITRHEDLLDDIEGEVRRICDFIDLDFRPGMLSFEQSARTVSTPSAHQLRAGLNRSSVGQWRHYEEQMTAALAHLAPWVRRFDYAE